MRAKTCPLIAYRRRRCRTGPTFARRVSLHGAYTRKMRRFTTRWMRSRSALSLALSCFSRALSSSLPSSPGSRTTRASPGCRDGGSSPAAMTLSPRPGHLAGPDENETNYTPQMVRAPLCIRPAVIYYSPIGLRARPRSTRSVFSPLVLSPLSPLSALFTARGIAAFLITAIPGAHVERQFSPLAVF